MKTSTRNEPDDRESAKPLSRPGSWGKSETAIRCRLCRETIVLESNFRPTAATCPHCGLKFVFDPQQEPLPVRGLRLRYSAVLDAQRRPGAMQHIRHDAARSARQSKFPSRRRTIWPGPAVWPCRWLWPWLSSAAGSIGSGDRAESQAVGVGPDCSLTIPRIVRYPASLPRCFPPFQLPINKMLRPRVVAPSGQRETVAILGREKGRRQRAIVLGLEGRIAQRPVEIGGQRRDARLVSRGPLRGTKVLDRRLLQHARTWAKPGGSQIQSPNAASGDAGKSRQ